MVTGTRPFTGDTPREVMLLLLRKSTAAHDYIRQPPAELQQIISKRCGKTVRNGINSAHDLLQALKDLRRKFGSVFFCEGFFDELKRRKVYRVAAA